MTPELTAVLIPGLLTFMGGVAGWWAKITIAAISAKPKVEGWNGSERRSREIITAEVTMHALNCPAKKDFTEALTAMRLEMKQDMQHFKEEIRESLHNLHEEIQRSKA